MTEKRRDVAVRALEEGITPLDVMLSTMRALWAKAHSADGTVDSDLAKEAADIAKDAAPYVHPKLAAIEHSGNIDFMGVEHGDLASEFASIAAAAGFEVAKPRARPSAPQGAGAKKPH